MIATLQLEELTLGDVVTFPDGRDLSVRSVVSLKRPVGPLAGFALLGEMEMLIGAPASRLDLCTVYLPVEQFPYAADAVRGCVEGAARYWAPHLPAVAGAMGEILYRIAEVRGSIDPVILVYRGPEVIVFLRTGHVAPEALQLLRMAVPGEEQAVDRHAATLKNPVHATPVIEHAYGTLTGVR